MKWLLFMAPLYVKIISTNFESFDTVQFIHGNPAATAYSKFCTVEGISFDERIAIPFWLLRYEILTFQVFCYLLQ